MKLPDAVKALSMFEDHLKSQTKSPRTRDVYLHSARHFLKWSNNKVDPKLVGSYLNHLIADGCAYSTASMRYHALRAFFKVFKAEKNVGALAYSTYTKAEAKYVKAEEINLIFDACQDTREKAIVMILWTTLIRRQELLMLAPQDVHFKPGFLRVIRAKRRSGEMFQYIGLDDETRQMISRYMLDFNITQDSDRLFPLKLNTLYRLLQSVCKRAGVPEYAPHAFRHGGGTWYSDNGMTLGDLQWLLGHNSPVTTAGYTHKKAETIKSKMTVMKWGPNV